MNLGHSGLFIDFQASLAIESSDLSWNGNHFRLCASMVSEYMSIYVASSIEYTLELLFFR